MYSTEKKSTEVHKHKNTMSAECIFSYRRALRTLKETAFPSSLVMRLADWFAFRMGFCNIFWCVRWKNVFFRNVYKFLFKILMLFER